MVDVLGAKRCTRQNSQSLGRSCATTCAMRASKSVVRASLRSRPRLALSAPERSNECRRDSRDRERPSRSRCPRGCSLQSASRHRTKLPTIVATSSFRDAIGSPSRFRVRDLAASDNALSKSGAFSERLASAATGPGAHTGQTVRQTGQEAVRAAGTGHVATHSWKVPPRDGIEVPDRACEYRAAAAACAAFRTWWVR